MLKTSPCPNCQETTIVITHDAGLDRAFPECFKCNYRGSPKYKKHMIIENVAEEFLNCGRNDKKQELMDFAAELWNEVIGMEKLESDPNYFGDEIEEADDGLFEEWYDVPTEELLLEDETDSNKK